MVIAQKVDPDAFYDERGVCHLLDISIDRVREECNRKRLRHTKRVGNRYIKGQWLINWLEGKDASFTADGGEAGCYE